MVSDGHDVLPFIYLEESYILYLESYDHYMFIKQPYLTWGKLSKWLIGGLGRCVLCWYPGRISQSNGIPGATGHQNRQQN